MSERPLYANAGFAHRTNQELVMVFAFVDHYQLPNGQIVKEQRETAVVVMRLEAVPAFLQLVQDALRTPDKPTHDGHS